MLMLAGKAWGQDTIVVLAGRLLDPATGVTSTNQRILIVGGKIVAVGSPRTGDANRHVIDLSRYTVLPGLIDAHVHLAIGGTARANARADLRAGFTTVVDLGARTTRLLRIRDSINVGLIEGPRVLGAGIWIGTKGGVCEFNGIGIEGGPESFVARVHENVAAGADVVKACISGWPAEAFAKPESVQMNDETIAAIVQASHAAKRLVIAHDISLAGVKAALRAGVDDRQSGPHVGAEGTSTDAPGRLRSTHSTIRVP